MPCNGDRSSWEMDATKVVFAWFDAIASNLESSLMMELEKILK
jgi:hypothetical protein